MPPANKTAAELGELAERLRAIAKVLRDIPPQHPVSPESLDDLRKEIEAVATDLLRQGALDEGDKPRH